MAKTLVTRGEDGARVPFLRGVLTRSLQQAGLTFDDAYAVATEVRDELRQEDGVSTAALRELVKPHLAPFGKAVLTRYIQAHTGPPRIMVIHGDGSSEPLSRGRQRFEFARCGLNLGEATSAAEAIHARLDRDGVTRIEQPDLLRLTYGYLHERVGITAARNLVLWEAFHASERPLIVLIGGTGGSGKSTIAAQLAPLLEVVRAQSTDMLREVMRMLIPQRLLPVLHTSSYNAWEVIPTRGRAGEDFDSLLIDGYLSQVQHVNVACEAIIRRAAEERVSLVLEGVHMHPGIGETLPQNSDLIMVHAMLAVLKPRELKRRFRGRGKKTPGRRAARYLKHFDEIWSLQGHLLSEADRVGVPIVANEDREEAVRELLALVMKELSTQFSDDPKQVFV